MKKKKDYSRPGSVGDRVRVGNYRGGTRDRRGHLVVPPAEVNTLMKGWGRG